MNFGASRGPSRSQQIAGAAFCCAIAVFIAYVVWSDNPGLRTPPAIAYTAAAIFGAAGISLLLQAYGRERGSAIVVTLLLAGMTAIAAWMAIGSGGRACIGTIGFFNFAAGQGACRAIFGVSAMLTGLIALVAGRGLFK